MINTPAFRLADNVSFTQVDDEMVLLELNSGRYFGLNNTGSEMLLALIDGDSLENCCRILADQYQVDAEQVQKDMEILLNQLIEQQLLVKATST